MKKSIIYATLGAIVFASCSRDLFDETSKKSQAELNQHAESVLGFKIDPNQDWKTTVSGDVDFNVDPSQVSKIQLLVRQDEGVTDDEEQLPLSSLRVLTEAKVNGRSSLKLTYDAPMVNEGIYAAFFTTNGYVFKKVNGNKIDLTGATTRAGEAETLPYTLPNVDLHLTDTVHSWDYTFGNRPNDIFFKMSDADEAKIKLTRGDDYSAELKENINALIEHYLPNHTNNMLTVKQTECYNAAAYAITQKKNGANKPIIVSPIFKQDGGSRLGDEVLNADLYYYYYNEKVDMGADTIKFLESLPKYKAFSLKNATLKENVLKKDCSFALIYWGDEDDALRHDNKGSFYFPDGYKIGFMLREKGSETYEVGKHWGELYCDGRLNNYVSKRANFSTAFKNSGVSDEDAPMMAWLTVGEDINDVKHLICCETGTDGDLNDVLFEVEGDLIFPPVTPPETHEWFTYCFEDTEEGDFDLNDVVIQAYRTNETTVTYYITACGAWDELYIQGLDEGSDKAISDKEVHTLFGLAKGAHKFVNTKENETKYDPYVITRTVDPSFTFYHNGYDITILNATKGNTVELSRTGENPHGILVPGQFWYPQEKTPVSEAYKPHFNEWGEREVTYSQWYENEYAIKNLVYKLNTIVIPEEEGSED